MSKPLAARPANMGLRRSHRTNRRLPGVVDVPGSVRADRRLFAFRKDGGVYAAEKYERAVRYFKRHG